jgi:hypothetical protein
MPGRLTAEEIVTIKTLASKGVAVRAIARQLGKNESSVRHHARESDEGREDGRRNKVAKCDALAPEIEAWATAHSKGERPTNVRELYEWLVAERHYDGSYKAVVRWVRAVAGGSRRFAPTAGWRRRPGRSARPTGVTSTRSSSRAKSSSSMHS